MSAWEFRTDGPVDLQLRILSGRVTVSATAAQTAAVTIVGSGPGARADATATVAFDQGTLTVSMPGGPWPGRHGSVDATVELPEGSSCNIDATSADVKCTGQLGAVDIRTMSGDIDVEQVSGLARLQTGSGDVALGAAGEAEAQTTSGDVGIGQVGDATIRTVSGDVGIAVSAGREVEVKCSSGDIGVGIAPGRAVYLDLSSVSGTVSSELEPAEGADEAEMTLTCRTISGEVTVSSASQVAGRAANRTAPRRDVGRGLTGRLPLRRPDRIRPKRAGWPIPPSGGRPAWSSPTHRTALRRRAGRGRPRPTGPVLP